jgi:hypothetical protein
MWKRYRPCITIALLCVPSWFTPVFAQDLLPNGLQSEPPNVQPGEEISSVLERGYRQIRLGTPFAVVQDRLSEDESFFYRGDPDVSLSLSDSQQVIDSRGRGYMERGLFQFYDGALYVITLYLDRRQLDYFQLFARLQERYGPPSDLDPRRAVWEDEETRIELERPLTVRYLDLETFLARRTVRDTARAFEDVTRERFLEDF